MQMLGFQRTSYLFNFGEGGLLDVADCVCDVVQGFEQADLLEGFDTVELEILIWEVKGVGVEDVGRLVW